MIAVRDRPLLLHCQVEGEAPITITWYRNGAVLSNAAVLANGSLRLESVHRRSRGGAAEGAANASDTSAGEYSCAAQNRYGLLVSRKARVQIASEFASRPCRGQLVSFINAVVSWLFHKNRGKCLFTFE